MSFPQRNHPLSKSGCPSQQRKQKMTLRRSSQHSRTPDALAADWGSLRKAFGQKKRQKKSSEHPFPDDWSMLKGLPPFAYFVSWYPITNLVILRVQVLNRYRHEGYTYYTVKKDRVLFHSRTASTHNSLPDSEIAASEMLWTQKQVLARVQMCKQQHLHTATREMEREKQIIATSQKQHDWWAEQHLYMSTLKLSNKVLQKIPVKRGASCPT